MKQDEFIAAVRKQQSLIRKLTSNRRRRAEVMDELTKKRYGHLVGRFFRPGERINGALDGVTYYICGVCASAYATGDVVGVWLDCRFMGTVADDDGSVVSMTGFGSKTFRFGANENIDDILADLWVPKEKAIREMDAIYQGFKKSFLRKSSSDQKE